MYNKRYSVVEYNILDRGQSTTVLMNTDDLGAANRFMREYADQVLSVYEYRSLPSDATEEDLKIAKNEFLKKHGNPIRMSPPITNHKMTRTVIIFEKKEDSMKQDQNKDSQPSKEDMLINHYLKVVNDLYQLEFTAQHTDDGPIISVKHPTSAWSIVLMVTHKDSDKIVYQFLRSCIHDFTMTTEKDLPTQVRRVMNRVMNITDNLT